MKAQPALSLFVTAMLAVVFFGTMTISAQAQTAALKDHDTYQPIDIIADKMEVYEKLGRAIIEGGVKVTQGNMTLTAENLLIFYERAKGATDPSIQRLDASGKVTLTSATETATGNWGIYDVEARLVTLSGDVSLKRGDNILTGDKLELDLVSGLAKLDGKSDSDGTKQRVKGRFSVPTKK